MTANFLFSLLIVLSVQVFVTRILYRDKRTLLFSREIMTKIGTFYCFFVFLIFFSYFKQPFHLWFILLLSFFVFPISFFFLKKYRQQQFCSEFLRFLSLLILKMKMGMAFRSSYESTLSESQWKFRSLLASLLENVVFSPHETVANGSHFTHFLNEIIKEFSFFDSHPHFAIDGLKNFQERLVKRTFFRRRSRQIYYQMGGQLVVLSIIYVSVFAFVVFEFGWRRNIYIFILSGSLYLGGSLIFYLTGRRKQWNI